MMKVAKFTLLLLGLFVTLPCSAIPTNSRGEYLVKKLKLISQHKGTLSFEYDFTYDENNEIIGIEFIYRLEGQKDRTVIKRRNNHIERTDYDYNGYKVGNITYEYKLNDAGEILSSAMIDHSGGKPWKQQTDFNYEDGMLVHSEWHDYYAKSEKSPFILDLDGFHSKQYFYVDANIVTTLYSHSYHQANNSWTTFKENPYWKNITYTETPNNCNLELTSLFMRYPVSESTGENYLFLAGWMNIRGSFLLDSFGEQRWDRIRIDYTFDEYGRPVKIHPVPDNDRKNSGAYVFDYVLEYVDE